MKRFGAIAAIAVTVASINVGIVSADTRVEPVDFIPICVDAASQTSVWEAVNEKNNVDVPFSWYMNDYPANTGDETAFANATTYFGTDYNPADPNNTTSFKQDGYTDVTRNEKIEPCTDEQLGWIDNGGDNTGNTGTDNGAMTGGMGGGDTTQTGTGATTSSTTTTNAQPAAAPAAQLADTGASRTVPFAAASVIALFTAAMTVLVRKNVL